MEKTSNEPLKSMNSADLELPDLHHRTDETPLQSPSRRVHFQLGWPSAGRKTRPSSVVHDSVTDPLLNVAHHENINQNDMSVVELYDLSGDNKNWTESARWLKYEEDVVGTDRKFGAPHVPLLGYEDLISLRDMLTTATVLPILNVVDYNQLIKMVERKLQDLNESPIIIAGIEHLMSLRRIHASSRQLQRTRTHNELKKSDTSPEQNLAKVKSADGIFMHHSHHHTYNHDHNPLVRTQSFFGRLLSRETKEVLTSSSVFVGGSEEIREKKVVIVRLEHPVLFPEDEEKRRRLDSVADAPHPIKMLVFILGPTDPSNYHEIGRAFCTLLSNKDFKQVANIASTGEPLVRAVDSFLLQSAVLPPGEIDNERLIPVEEITRRCNTREHNEKMRKDVKKHSFDDVLKETKIVIKNDFENGGIVSTTRNFWSRYISDFTDPFYHLYTCITAVLFMFLAAIAPTLTFGGLLGKYTDGRMGLRETLIAQCVCGIIWAFFSSQPLIIVSATGPVMVFEASLYSACEKLDVDFGLTRCVCALTILCLCIIIAACRGVRLLRFVTKFTEDIFTVLISIIFLSEGFKFLLKTFRENPSMNLDFYEAFAQECLANFPPEYCNTLGHPNTALLTMIVAFATCGISTSLKLLRGSTSIGRMVRSAAADFGVAISLFVVIFSVYTFVPNVYLETLQIPDEVAEYPPIYFNVDYKFGRSIVFGFMTAFPLFGLLFVETGITDLLLAKRENKLQKGTCPSWDIVLIGILAVFCSFFNLPIMCAAAVQSVAHTNALTIRNKPAPGAKEEIVKVVENRLTNLIISILVGLVCIFGKHITIPTASLFGVFIYLGVMNLRGLEFTQRLPLMVRPFKYWPKEPYVRMVRQWKIHLFTAIQFILIVVVFIVKLNPYSAMGFPIVLGIFMYIRHKVLPYFFTEDELLALDGEEFVAETSMDDENDLGCSV